MNCAIILAAGNSTRMGEPKVLLPLGGTTVLGHIVGQIARSAIDEIYVIVGSQEERIREAVAEHRVVVVRNPDHNEGMLSSVRCGLRALPPASTGVLIALGDQPRIVPSVVDTLLAALPSSGRGIVVPVHERRRGHPLVFASRYIPEVLERHDATGLRGLLSAHPRDVLEVEVPDDSVLSDMDSPSDYERERRRYERDGRSTT